jgi:uncharacterized membrane protein
MEQAAEQEVSADTAIGKFQFKGSSLNTLSAVATLIVVCMIGYVLYAHAGDTKETNRELVGAIREMAQANREQNCLLRFDQKDRQSNADFCRQLSR